MMTYFGEKFPHMVEYGDTILILTTVKNILCDVDVKFTDNTFYAS